MFEQCIKESKPTPDYSDSDSHQVSVVLRGDVQDPRFLRFLERVGKEKLESFGVEDLLALDHIYHERPVPETLRGRLSFLREQGLVERVGRGRGVRYVLSRSFHSFLGQKGVYTRRKGLDRSTNKELLLKHIKDNRRDGSKLADLMQVLPDLTRGQVQGLLAELREEGRAFSAGRTKASRWYPGPSHGKNRPE